MGRDIQTKKKVARCVVMILLSVGISEKQIMATDIEVLAESAIVIYCQNRSKETDCKICPDWDVNCSQMADVGRIEWTILPCPRLHMKLIMRLQIDCVTSVY